MGARMTSRSTTRPATWSPAPRTTERRYRQPRPAMRFLVVEDDDKLARAIARGLRHEGYAVDRAADGDAALMQTAVYEYDAVILDLMLPGRDGFEVCRALRERECWAP